MTGIWACTSEIGHGALLLIRTLFTHTSQSPSILMEGNGCYDYLSQKCKAGTNCSGW